MELITSNIDAITSSDVLPSSRAPPSLVEGVHTADMIIRHFKNTLMHILARKEFSRRNDDAASSTEGVVDWSDINVVVRNGSITNVAPSLTITLGCYFENGNPTINPDLSINIATSCNPYCTYFYLNCLFFPELARTCSEMSQHFIRHPDKSGQTYES